MTKRIALALIALIALVALSGCFHQRVVVDNNYNPSKSVPDLEKIYFHFLGLVPINANANLSAACPNGAGIVEKREYFSLQAVGIPVQVSSLSVYCQ